MSTVSASERAEEEARQRVPFPRVFWVAIGLEVLERLAFYGVYINLAVYLAGKVGMTDKETGALLGVFALVRAWLPVATGAIADKLGFRRSLLVSFASYVLAYAALFAFPSRWGAWGAVMGMALAGAFLKPVIPGTVRRYAPKGRESQGFSYFYASVNAGSVVGKIGTKIVRTLVSLRASMVNSIVACAVAFVIAFAAFFEPHDLLPKETKAPADADREGREKGYRELQERPEEKTETLSVGASLLRAVTEPRLVIFLVLVSGYYLLIEQFYQTFPVYIVRVFGEKAPREEITLINPLSIAIFQVLVGKLTKKLPALPAMAFGIFVAAVSMAIMAVPHLALAGTSFFVFAIAEMIYSPRYYEYVSSFAPKGREGLYMGLALVPFGFGGLVGGVLSGRLIAAYLPKEGGERAPHLVWGTYAVIGLVCALALGIFARVYGKKLPEKPTEEPAS
jgi:dipeptide/tripeptide permease